MFVSRNTVGYELVIDRLCSYVVLLDRNKHKKIYPYLRREERLEDSPTVETVTEFQTITVDRGFRVNAWKPASTVQVAKAVPSESTKFVLKVCCVFITRRGGLSSHWDEGILRR